jgi:uncharacterized protein (TIGR02466 family)
MKETITPLASIPLYTCEDALTLSKDELQTLLDLKYNPTTNNGGNYITENKQILDLPEFANLKHKFQTYLDHYTKDLLKITDKFIITDSWSTHNPKGSYHPAHEHPNSIFSGIFYVNITSGDLQLIFEPQYSKQFKFNYNFAGYNYLNSSSWTLGPKPGMLFIFPSWVMHGVEENTEDADRRIIGFNSFVCGKFGNNDTIDNLSIDINPI